MATNNMEKTEFEFPDEVETKEKKSAKQDDDFNFEVEDDTPPADRNREPLPKNIVDELDNDELEEYSDKVKTKMLQMKKVWHDERREKERALREQQEAINFAQKILEENKSLKRKASTTDETLVNTYKTSIELELDAARKEYKEAYDTGDSDQLLAAQEKLSNANYKLQKVKDYRPQPLQEEDFSVNNQLQQKQVSHPDPKAVSWQERNAWFGEDEEMTASALGLHEKLVKQHGMAYATTDEYYKRVDETMRRRFPESFEGQEEQPEKQRSKPSSIVAPANRSTSSKRIVLKQSQINIAKRLGLTNEQYAREIMKMEANNG